MRSRLWERSWPFHYKQEIWTIPDPLRKERLSVGTNDLVSSCTERTAVGQKEKHMQTGGKRKRAELSGVEERGREGRGGEGRGGGSGGGLEYPSKSDQFMLLNSSRRLLKAGGGLGSMLVYRWWEIISYSPQLESPDSCSYQRMKYWGHDRSGTLNDISVCCSSRATRIPRGWMGQFRSRSEYKLIRELGERVSIKETWIELCLSFQLSGFSWTCM